MCPPPPIFLTRSPLLWRRKVGNLSILVTPFGSVTPPNRSLIIMLHGRKKGECSQRKGHSLQSSLRPKKLASQFWCSCNLNFYEVSSSGIDLRGEWPGVGSRIDFRKSKVGHLSICPKMVFWGIFRVFLVKFFKNVKIWQFFTQTGVTFQNFRRLWRWSGATGAQGGTCPHTKLGGTNGLVPSPQSKLDEASDFLETTLRKTLKKFKSLSIFWNWFYLQKQYKALLRRLIIQHF